MATPTAPHLRWHVDALWQRLQPLLPGLAVEVMARVDSTSSALVDRLRRAAGNGARDSGFGGAGLEVGDATGRAGMRGRASDEPQACLLVAEHQTRGRGRLGRTWQSSPGASLTFSLGLPYAPLEWSGLSLAIGAALADAIEPPVAAFTPRIGLKWPNDLWLLPADPTTPLAQGRKLGGVLIETIPVAGRRMCIVGIGLNVQPQQIEGLSTGYACVQELAPELDAPALLARVAPPLVEAVRRFEREGFGPFEAAFAQRDLLRGQLVTTTLPELPEGRAEGVDATGALQLRGPDGRLHAVIGGEVSVRPLGPAAEPD